MWVGRFDKLSVNGCVDWRFDKLSVNGFVSWRLDKLSVNGCVDWRFDKLSVNGFVGWALPWQAQLCPIHRFSGHRTGAVCVAWAGMTGCFVCPCLLPIAIGSRWFG